MTDDKRIKEIQDEILRINTDIKPVTFLDVVNESRQIIIKAVLDAFGLSYFADRAGGNVTTLYNFKKGITAARDEQRYKEYASKQDKYDRSPYDRVQKSHRDPIIKSDKPIESGYTGKNIPHDGRSELEHIVPAAEIEKSAENNLFMSQEERVELAYNEENLTMVEKEINRSKQDMPLDEWLNKKRKHNPGKGQTEAEYFGIDIDKAKALDEKARNAIKKEQRKAAVKKQGKEILQSGLQEGFKIGVREVFGLILVEFADASIRCIQRIVKMYKKGIYKNKQVLTEFKKALLETKENVIKKYDEMLSRFKSSVLSGFLSTILTFIINNFITTAKRVVIIIRETVYSLVRAGKIMVGDEYHTHEEKVNAATDLILKSLTVCLTTLIALSIQEALTGVPYGDCFSQAVASIVVGLTVAMVTYYFESINADLIETTVAVATTAGTTVEAIRTVKMIDEERDKNIKRLDENTKGLSEIIK